MLPTPLRLGTLYDKVHLRDERSFRSGSLRGPAPGSRPFFQVMSRAVSLAIRYVIKKRVPSHSATSLASTGIPLFEARSSLSTWLSPAAPLDKPREPDLVHAKVWTITGPAGPASFCSNPRHRSPI